jgi:dTDP-4-dehydrorhamnose reductase
MNILITGASGMLGSALAKQLSKNHEIFATGNSDISLPFNYKPYDLIAEDYDELIKWSSPQLIIHCAALTNGNYCHNNPLEAFNVNGYSVRKLLDSTPEKVKIIYISTDAVFSSKLHLAKETDCTNPESVYGKSKEIGEFFLLNSERESLIIRTTILGLNAFTDKAGFVEWIINSANLKHDISLFDDVQFNPISIWDLCNELNYLIDQDNYKSKIYHISGKEITTKYNFGIQLLKHLDIPNTHIKKGSIIDFSGRAKRSNDQTISVKLYEDDYNRRLPDLKGTIEAIKMQYNDANKIR